MQLSTYLHKQRERDKEVDGILSAQISVASLFMQKRNLIFFQMLFFTVRSM